MAWYLASPCPLKLKSSTRPRTTTPWLVVEATMALASSWAAAACNKPAEAQRSAAAIYSTREAPIATEATTPIVERKGQGAPACPQAGARQSC